MLAIEAGLFGRNHGSLVRKLVLSDLDEPSVAQSAQDHGADRSLVTLCYCPDHLTHMGGHGNAELHLGVRQRLWLVYVGRGHKRTLY